MILATAALPLTLSVMLTIAAVLLHLASAEGSILPANCLALAAAVQCCAACEYAGAARRGGAEAAACFSMALPGEYARVYAAWYAGPRHVEWSTPAVLLPFIALAAAYLRAFHLFLCSVEHTVSAIVLYILCPAFMAFVYEGGFVGAASSLLLIACVAGRRAGVGRGGVYSGGVWVAFASMLACAQALLSLWQPQHPLLAHAGRGIGMAFAVHHTLAGIWISHLA